MAWTKQQTEEAKLSLKRDYGLKRNAKIYVKCTHYSKSGMMRTYDVYIIHRKELLRITHSVCQACGYTYNRNHDGLQIGGTGFSGDCDIAYSLSYALFKSTKNLINYQSI